MYSYEERMRAVELYIKLGKRVRATIRELGYPTKKSLKGWHREFERRQDLRIRSVSRPPKFSDAQKRMALEHYVGQGRCISWTLRALRQQSKNLTMRLENFSGGTPINAVSTEQFRKALLPALTEAVATTLENPTLVEHLSAARQDPDGDHLGQI